MSSPQARLRLPYSILWSDSIRIYSAIVTSPALEIRHRPHPRLPDQELRIDELLITGGSFAQSGMQIRNVRLEASGGTTLRIKKLSAEIEHLRVEASGKAAFHKINHGVTEYKSKIN